MFLRLGAGLSIFLMSGVVLAATYSSTVRDGGTRFLARSLGSTCYSMDSFRRGLPCNPAFVAKDKEPRFDTDLLLGSNAEYLKEAEALLDGQSSESQVAKLFSRREMVEGELSLEASFQRPTWGVAIEPYRIVYVSQFENASLPMVDFIASEEQSVKAQLASFTAGNFYAGLQLRYTHVRFVGNYVSVVEAVAGQNDELFEVRNQDLFYVEPGLLYAWEDVAWEPQISAMLSQWGWTSKKTEQYPIRPQGLVGASVKPMVPLGTFEVGLQLQVDSETRNGREAFRGALAYQLGILQTVFSASESDQAASFLVSYKSISTGLSYWGDNSNRTVFMHLGVTL